MISPIIKVLNVFSLDWSVDLRDHITMTHSHLVKISIFPLLPLLPTLCQIVFGIFDLRQRLLVMGSGSGAASLDTETKDEDKRPNTRHNPGHPTLWDGVKDVDILVNDSVHLDPLPDPVQHQPEQEHSHDHENISMDLN